MGGSIVAEAGATSTPFVSIVLLAVLEATPPSPPELASLTF